jgi:putative transposase
VPRPLRVQAPNTTYHVTGHSTDRWRLFVANRDREHFTETFASVVEKYEWTCLWMCLMDTHYHLLFRTTHANIAAGMQELNSRYAQAFNHRHTRPGHLFRARYHAVVVEEPGHLVWLLRYMARNPVEAGLCAAPSEWQWSSYPGLVGDGIRWSFLARDEVLRLFGPEPVSAATRLRAFVEADR